MQKVIIVTHRSESEALLDAMQQAGTVQVLDAERAMVTKEWPELQSEFKRPRDLEEIVERLAGAIAFLKPFAGKTSASLLAPRMEVSAGEYSRVVKDKEALELLDKVEHSRKIIEDLSQHIDGLAGEIHKLAPWLPLRMPVHELGGMKTFVCFAGLLPEQNIPDALARMDELQAAVERVGPAHRAEAWLVVCLRDASAEVQKALRQADFEAVVFDSHKGTPAEITARLQADLAAHKADLEKEKRTAAKLAEKQVALHILHDHYRNLVARVRARDAAPASEHAMFLEGWIKAKDYRALQKIVSGFEASSVSAVQPGEDEECPVEIDNSPAFRPFETITRLYGIPSTTDVDPTAFLAPFFAIFFGLCLTDAGYGLVLVALLAWVLKKLQGDKKAIWMLMVCSVITIIAGAITGGWFADTIPTLLPQTEGSIGAALHALRQKMMLFDPMEKPLVFIGIALALGYTQVLFGLGIAFVNLLRHRNYAAAVFEKLTWLILLNCLVLFALAKRGILPAGLAPAVGLIALVQVILIFWFTERNSGLAGRIGGGVFAVFSTVFYLGDMLSYVRIMALGMVTAGLGMAVNILTKLVMEVPYIGFLLGLLLFVGGHAVNIALSLLGAFVHSLRLQFVEFFPKFFAGGGREFKPLRNDYQHVLVLEAENANK